MLCFSLLARRRRVARAIQRRPGARSLESIVDILRGLLRLFGGVSCLIENGFGLNNDISATLVLEPPVHPEP
jgi:hypothetical protein